MSEPLGPTVHRVTHVAIDLTTVDISAADISADAAVYVISVAAELSGMHPQTLRQYDRLGLVSPGRTGGGGRRYSARDIARLREVARLSQQEGVNLAGIKRIMELEHQVDALHDRVGELLGELSTMTRRHRSGDYRPSYLPVRLDDVEKLPVWRPARREPHG